MFLNSEMTFKRINQRFLDFSLALTDAPGRNGRVP
jgi:hypothetical protein